MFELDLFQPLYLIGTVQFRFSAPRQFEKESKTAVPELLDLAGAQQSLSSILADGLEESIYLQTCGEVAERLKAAVC